jgi:hypothetical protein
MSKTKAKTTTTKTEAKRSKTKAKASRRITRASTSKASATKTSGRASDNIGLLVLGFDEHQKPCSARFVGAKPELVAKAAQLMGLKVYKTTSPDVAEVAKKLPVGQLYATGRAFVPNVRQSLYSEVLVALSAEPQQAAIGPDRDKASTPVARGLPGSWDEMRPATSSSRKRASPTAGGRRSCSTAKTTCSRCGSATTRGSPSSFAIAPRSR